MKLTFEFNLINKVTFKQRSTRAKSAFLKQLLAPEKFLTLSHTQHADIQNPMTKLLIGYAYCVSVKHFRTL